jgi:hypothetical protein
MSARGTRVLRGVASHSKFTISLVRVNVYDLSVFHVRMRWP